MTAPAQLPASIRVLLIDDTPDIRILLKVALELEGFVVVGEAGDGRAGVDVARASQPDVVLLDLAMPVMDGLEALPLLRQASPHAKLVVLSGFEAGSMKAAALDAGAHAYLQKGASPNEIVQAVHEAVGSSPPSRGLRGLSPPAAEAWRWLGDCPTGVVLLDEARATVLRANAVACELLAWLPAPPPDAAQDLLRRLEQPDAALRATEVTGDGHTLVYLTQSDSAAEQLDLLRSALASAAHEIRNPVTTLLGVAHTLSSKRDRIAAEMQDKLLDAMARQARVLDRITSDLLTVSQAERDQLWVHPEDVALLPSVEGAIAASGLEVEVAVDGALTVRADTVRVDQMLINLLTNAAKYGAPPYRVTAAASGDLVHVCVEDTGDGVPEQFRSSLFEQFTRAEGTRVAGSGIGLFIVRALAEAQGGSASYEPLPRGSRFSFALPRAWSSAQ